MTSKQPNGRTRESWRKDKTRSGENKPGPEKILQGKEYKETRGTENRTGTTAKLNIKQ